MKKKTIKKKSPRKKGATKTKKKVLEKTARDKKIEVDSRKFWSLYGQYTN